ncbi:MAG: PrgI family protein [Patescibacteria group bacterium]
MNQIIVPQFLDIEDKIIGPVTVRQFVEMLVAGLFCFIFYKIFDFSLFVALSLITAGATLVVAFVKINGQSFHYFLLNIFATFKSPRLKVWKKSVSMNEVKLAAGRPKEVATRPVRMRRQHLTSSKISEISLIVDTGGVYRGENGI